MRRTFDGRRLAVIAVWLLVGLKLGFELTGRGRTYWQADLATLHREQSTFYAGIYPHFAVERPGTAGGEVRSAYPPFSFVLFLPWLPPGLNWDAARGWFTACQLGALGYLLVFAWRMGAEGGRSLSWLLVGAVVAMGGVRADLLFGNMSLITTALLVGVYRAAERGRWGAAGAGWVASMVKPQMGWLFALLFLRRGGWRPLVTGLAALVTCAGVAFAWTGVDPAGFVRSSYGGDLRAWSSVAQLNNLGVALASWGVPTSVALVGSATLGLIVGGWFLRGPLVVADVLRQFAIIGVINRVCTYHNYCDDLLLVFALAWVGRHAWNMQNWVPRLAFAVLAVSVWLPAFALAFAPVRTAVLLSWVAVAAWIAFDRSTEGRPIRQTGGST